jgi:group I intron endonuclease
MTGIYKITSPNGKVYIGKSVNIKRRFKEYNRGLAKGQTLLNRSFLKYGVENHIFEILFFCDFENLNNLERYYQLLFSSIGKNGLNIVLNGEKTFESTKELKKRNDVINIINNILF